MSDDPASGKEPLPKRIVRKPSVVAPGVDRDGLYWMRENYKQQLDRSNETRIVPLDKILINVVGKLQPGGKRPEMTQEAVRAALRPVLGDRLTDAVTMIKRGHRPGLVLLGFEHMAYAVEVRPLLPEIKLALAPFKCTEVRFCLGDDDE